MRFTIGETSIPDNSFDAYPFRRKIEFIFLSEYRKYSNELNTCDNALLSHLATLLIQMPTSGAFTESALHKVCNQLGIENDASSNTDTPFYKSKWFKVYIHLARALITRVIRATENIILTWGNPNNKVPDPFMITLLYLAWIYPLIRLSTNLFTILQYVAGYEGTEFEKSLSWKMRATDQLQRFWPELLTDVLWVAIRGAGCVYALPTPPPLSVTLFGSRVALETATTIYTKHTYTDLNDETLKALILKDREKTMGIWLSYFLGALPGLLNQFALAIGSIWIATTCVAQLTWELMIRENPMTLKPILSTLPDEITSIESFNPLNLQQNSLDATILSNALPRLS